MFRRRRRSNAGLNAIDPNKLQPRWRTAVEEALASRRRFQEVFSRSAPGPVRQRLEELAERVDEVVLACWRAAANAQAAEHALSGIDPLSVTERLKRVRRDLEAAERRGSPEADRLRLESEQLTAQHQSAHRVLNSLEETEEKLRLLDLRLDAAVLQAVDLVLLPSGGAERIDSEMDRLIDEMAALKAGIDEVDRLGAG